MTSSKFDDEADDLPNELDVYDGDTKGDNPAHHVSDIALEARFAGTPNCLCYETWHGRLLVSAVFWTKYKTNFKI